MRKVREWVTPIVGETIASVTCMARTGKRDLYKDEDSNTADVKVSALELQARVSCLKDIVTTITEHIIKERWNPADLAMLGSGVDQSGIRLPQKGSVVCRRLGWTGKDAIPENVYVPDRVYRVAQDHAIRLLKGSVYANKILQILLTTWPKNPYKRTRVEWEELWKLVRATPGLYVTKRIVRNRINSILNYCLKHRTAVLPTNITELEDPPHVPPLILFPAGDRQNVTLEKVVSEDGSMWGILRIKLPTCATPQRRKDWEWVTIHFIISSHVPTDAVLHTPNLRVKTTKKCNGKTITKLYIDLSYDRIVPEQPDCKNTGETYSRSVNFDWGVNTCMTGTLTTLDPGTMGVNAIVRTSGKPVSYKGSGIIARGHRQRIISERLSTKIAHYKKLVEGIRVPYALPKDTLNKLEILESELAEVSMNRKGLHHALAWSVAGWAIDYAKSQHATIIFVEDLKDLEARSLGKKQNVRCNSAIRSQIFEAMRHLGTLEGILVVEVPARNTSSLCARCLTKIKHVKAPDRLTELGHSWAYCPNCGYSADRDHSASERIGSRGLAGQEHIKVNKKTGKATISVTVDVPVRISREKKSKTKTIKRIKIVDKKTSKKRVVLRTKTAPTPKQRTSRNKGGVPHSGEMRLTSLVSTANNTNRDSVLVQRPVETSSSLGLPSGIVRQPGGTIRAKNKLYSLTKTKAQRRREQSRGFPLLSYPSWVSKRVNHPVD